MNVSVLAYVIYFIPVVLILVCCVLLFYVFPIRFFIRKYKEYQHNENLKAEYYKRKLKEMDSENDT